MKNALYALFGVLAGFALAGILALVARAPSGKPIVLQPAPTPAPIVVDVRGGVARPGLYKLPEDARVQDAIDAAGGLLTTADPNSLNLARKIEDGEQLLVPCKEGACPEDETALELPNSDTMTTAAGETPGEGLPAELINVNTASLAELDALPGIGPSTAQKIIDYREQNGEFYAIEDLLNVSGIGEKTLEDIRDLITTGY